MEKWLVGFGAFCFGAVIGWVTKEAMVRTDKLSISHIAVVVGAVGGAAITKVYEPSGVPFALYCVGLAISFFAFTLLHDVDTGGNLILKRGSSTNPQRGNEGTKAKSEKRKPED